MLHVGNLSTRGLTARNGTRRCKRSLLARYHSHSEVLEQQSVTYGCLDLTEPVSWNPPGYVFKELVVAIAGKVAPMNVCGMLFASYTKYQ